MDNQNNLNFINEILPLEESFYGKLKRIKLFNLIDLNGNGKLSINEIHSGITKNIKLYKILNCKTAIFKALEAVRFSRGEKSKLQQNDQFIVFSEFKKFLNFLKYYFEYFVMFEIIDSDSNKKIDIYEFTAAMPIIQKWGLKIINPEKVFKEIDENESGFILFDEFCHWAIMNSLKIENC